MAKALPVVAVNPGGALSENAPLILHTRLEELYRFAVYVPDPLRHDELHAMRIAAKRLRYTLEIFAPVFQTPELAREFGWVYDKVKSIQEQIGVIHDADVRGPLLQDFLDKHAAARPEWSAGLQSLRDAQAKERAAQYRAFVQYWNKLQGQGFKARFLQLLSALSAPPSVPDAKPEAAQPNAIRKETMPDEQAEPA